MSSNKVNLTLQERINSARGYKAALNNPRVSDEAKQHAREALPEINEQEARQQLEQEAPQQHVPYHRERSTSEDMESQIPSSPQDRVNAARGYRAAIHNPLVSEEGKEHARNMYEGMNDEEARQELYRAQGRPKNPVRMAAGLKAAQRNPRVSEEGHRRATEQLHEIEHDRPEE
ncbi:hypothetical protein N7457_007663 [Penicillium paradoxum]|uniref:uncharacterized protein n=1 Tax=Penicillium paradoxum TaxID=176176 RepID=UPI002548ADAF|nr:uncharacterized protein N7457_007663 [Penicillium paradoxum]KAJ5772767.1 hypothetical protein N7457_007663 [Penicillium paradoxum]